MSKKVIDYSEDELWQMIGRGYEYACEMHDSIVEGRLPYGELLSLAGMQNGKVTGLPEDETEREDMACTFAVLALLLNEQGDPTVTVTVNCMAKAHEMMKISMSMRRLEEAGFLKRIGTDKFGLPMYTKIGGRSYER